MGTGIQAAYEARIADGRIESDPAQVEVLPELDRIRAHLEALPPPPSKKGLLSGLFQKQAALPQEKGLYLWGGVGRGKSMLMDLFFSEVDIAEKRRVHFHAFMQDVHKRLNEARKTDVDDAIPPVADALLKDLRLLCFDEVQITDIADAMIVGRLFQRFFDAGVVIVATSNRHPDDLYKEGLNRSLFLPFIELIKGRMEVHELVAHRDYRLDRLEASDTYMTPANAAARAKVDKLWQDLTGGEGEPLTLRVHNRDVVLPQVRDGVARVAFWELCARPLGPGDYLAIAEAVRVLILEDVPLLSRRNFNEAKRFVTLIDSLYEAKTRLIVTAADIPEHLYVEGEGTFEFGRTASRLREMQSAGWGE